MAWEVNISLRNELCDLASEMNSVTLITYDPMSFWALNASIHVIKGRMGENSPIDQRARTCW